MNPQQCPSEEQLIRFVDADLAPEVLDGIECHLGGCGTCAGHVRILKKLIADTAAVVPEPKVNVESHVAEVMSRISSEPRVAARRRVGAWGVTLAAAAALMLFIGQYAGVEEGAVLAPEFAPRGGPSQSSLSRDVGLQLYDRSGAPRALTPGSKIATTTPLAMGVRNLGKRAAYLLLFAVDARGEVHWIAPEYTQLGTDPVAYKVVPSKKEQLSATSVVFEDLAPGPMRVMAMITEAETRVSQIEGLGAEELRSERLIGRFPKAEIRQIALEVEK